MKGIINNTNRDELRTARNTTRANFHTVVSIFKESHYKNDERPAQTVERLVDALGYNTAVMTVAEIVNSVGEWDERVSRTSRAWAADIDTAATREELRGADIYQPSEIHPAHIDSLASAMRRYEPKSAEPETVEEPAETAPKTAQEKAEEEPAEKDPAEVIASAGGNGDRVLYLERRGCEFGENAPEWMFSDIGNYRLTTPTYSVRGQDGNLYHVEITRSDKYRIRTTNRRTGAPLKKPVRELIAVCRANFNLQYENDRGECRGETSIWRRGYDEEVPYTEAGILAFINSFSAIQYNRIEYVLTFDFVEDRTANFVPAWKIQDWAKRNHLEWFYHFDATHVRTHTGEYSYHHYHITPATADRESVTIYLERVSA